MPNLIVDVVDALNAGVASGEDFFVTVMDEGGGHRNVLARQLGEKTVCGMFATSEHLELFSAEAVEKAMNTDAETCARLPQQPDIRFVDARDVFPMLDLGTRREARPVESDH